MDGLAHKKKTNILGVGETNNAGPEPAWPKEEKNQQHWARISLAQQHNWPGGNYFPPSPPRACRTLFILHAGEKNNQNANNEGEEELPGVEEAVRWLSVCFASGAAVEADGGVMAHGRWLQVAALLFQAAESEILPLPFSSVSFPLLSFFSGFPLSSQFVFKFPTPFQAFPSS